ncbi:cap-specific mRNA (nucleoside-2'-O-)-methyltransferase 1-like [Mizuhopecten yessoensis]|uniref:cap-specific mRNA (nucleoside-2'-O-)-methyltransferase 1-like n=1 Tax=Mizuhopecten yessoensis TaxID=6573 RepID=UPI000B45CBF8|nr:cap-specific mRNA (nucleoside-2'-O-)-methyltransferase 1-like [Mizuhopecten yessoensis]
MASVNLSDSESEDERPMLGGNMGMGSFAPSGKHKLEDTGRDHEEGPSLKKPRKDKGSSYTEKAKRMMALMGYQAGKGLGKNEQGRTEIVEASKQKGRRGLGLRLAALEPDDEADWDFEAESITIEESVDWLPRCEQAVPDIETLRKWKLIGPKKRTIEDETKFCDEDVLRGILNSKVWYQAITFLNTNRRGKRSKSSAPLRILNINFQSLKQKLPRLANVIDRTNFKPDIIIGTETWLDPNIKDSEICLEGYSVYLKDRVTRGGGGVLIAICETLKCDTVLELDSNCVLLWVKLQTTGHSNIYICAYYRRHTSDKESLNQFELYVYRARNNQNTTIIIGGDLNFPGGDWSHNSLKPGAPNIPFHHQFKDVLDSNHLIQSVHENTRKDNNLDLLITNAPSIVQRVDVLPGISDHDIVFGEFDVHPVRLDQQRRQIPLYSKANRCGFIEEFHSILQVFEDMSKDASVTANDMWIVFKNAIMKGFKKFWTFIKHKRKDKFEIPSLKHEGKPFSDATTFSEKTTFTREEFISSGRMNPSPDSPIIDNINFTTNGIGGHFVCKLFDLFTPFSMGLVYLMYRIFDRVSIFKPVTSRPANSERYIVCRNLRGDREPVRQYMHEINLDLNKFMSATSEKDINEVVPNSLLEGDDEFFQYMYESNLLLGRLQITSLKKIQTFTQNSDLYEGRQSEIRRQCLERWQIPDQVRSAPSKEDPFRKFQEITQDEDEDFFEHSVSHLTHDSLAAIKTPYDYRCYVVGGLEKKRWYILGLGRSHVFKWDGNPKTKWRKMEENMRIELPYKTLIEVEFVQEFKGEGMGQKRLMTLHALDAFFLYGKDVRYLHFNERMEKLKKFVKAVNKPTRSDLVQIVVPNIFRLEHIEQIFERLAMKKVKGSSQLRLCYSPPDRKDGRSFLPTGVCFVKTCKDPWTIALSRSKGRKYFYNLHSKESKFEIPRESIASVRDTKLNTWWWVWEEGVKIHDSQTFNPHTDKVSKDEILSVIQGLLDKLTGQR